MTDAHKLLRKAGATQVKSRRHSVWMFQGVRFTLHTGTKPNSQEIFRVKCKLRRIAKAA